MLSKNEGIFTGLLIGALLFSGIALLLALLASLQPPAPTPRKDNQKPQQQTRIEPSESGHNQIPSNDNPPTRAEFLAEMGGQSQGDSGRPKHCESANDGWTAKDCLEIANAILLTAFTACLAWLAHRQRQAMLAQEKHMREANAKTQSIIEHMRDENRPWILILDPPGEITRFNSACEWTVGKNYGTTPGVIFELKISGGVVSGRQRLQDLIEDHEKSTPVPLNLIVAPGGDWHLPVPGEYARPLTDDAFESVLQPPYVNTIAFVISIGYFDIVARKPRFSRVLCLHSLTSNSLKVSPSYSVIT